MIQQFNRSQVGKAISRAGRKSARLTSLYKWRLIIWQFPVFIINLFFAQRSQAQTNTFEIYAHRGFRGLHPENTIQGMKKALGYGAVLEFDLNITKDRQVVVCHDAILNPAITLGPNGEVLHKDEKLRVFEMPYKALRTYDVGSKLHPDFPVQMRYAAYIPLFKELVDSVEAFAAARKMALPKYFIETKLNPKTDNVNHPQPEEFVDLMMQVVKEKGISQRMIVQSFDPRTLQVLKRKYPNIKLAFLAKAGTSLNDNLKWLGFKPDYYSANAPYIDSALVAQCKKLELKLIVGNCNNYDEISRIAKLGVNRVISDYPIEWLSVRKDNNKDVKSKASGH